eukprot:TRINITY_DN4970_c0_g1_i1.p2 TRINITY_DN4970_c0_g1~~TRINITY_DN4970_c0_g1_i1.p2  ORF type:complete len:120 (+),score=23.55 TRINITY_DN4970_c0_g1_i1:13-372(+)
MNYLLAIPHVAHVGFFVMESFLFPTSSKIQKIFGVPKVNVPAVKDWAFNQGFYNLFLAVGGLYATSLHLAGDVSGTFLLKYVYMCYISAALVLLYTRKFKSFAGPLIQGLAPAICLALM